VKHLTHLHRYIPPFRKLYRLYHIRIRRAAVRKSERWNLFDSSLMLECTKRMGTCPRHMIFASFHYFQKTVAFCCFP
jgi:hypothetical protein